MNTILRCFISKDFKLFFTMCPYKKYVINVSKPNEWLQLLSVSKTGFISPMQIQAQSGANLVQNSNSCS